MDMDARVNQAMVDEESVVTKARACKKILEADAVKYARSVEFSISDHTGCYVACCLHCCGISCRGSPCGGMPCCCMYHRACGEDCLCTPWCIGGVLPWPCLFCACREGNTWVNRDKYGQISNKLVLVDKEKGTLAWYCKECACPWTKPELNQNPRFYLVRLCGC